MSVSIRRSGRCTRGGLIIAASAWIDPSQVAQTHCLRATDSQPACMSVAENGLQVVFAAESCKFPEMAGRWLKMSPCCAQTNRLYTLDMKSRSPCHHALSRIFDRHLDQPLRYALYKHYRSP